jgi:hypothetical protein
MKTFVLTLGMLAAISLVKAQQWQPRLNNKLPLSVYKYKLDTTYNDLFNKNLIIPGNKGPLSAIPLNELATLNIDHMPVAKLRNTDKGMPIVQTDKTGYTMPVVGKALPRIYNMRTGPVIKAEGLKP